MTIDELLKQLNPMLNFLVDGTIPQMVKDHERLLKESGIDD